MKLLIVDDQHSVHMFLDKVVDYTSLNLTEVYHAYNGEEALPILMQHSPDIMVLDIQMPLMDGLELLKTLQERNLCVQTIILSAYNEFEYARKCMIYGVKDYILKPIDIQEFTEILSANIKALESELKVILEYEILNSIEQEDYSGSMFINFLHSLPINGIGVICFRCGDSSDSEHFFKIPTIFTFANEDLQLFIYSCECEGLWLEFLLQLQEFSEFSIGCSQYYSDFSLFPMPIKEAISALSQGFYHTGLYLFDKSFFCYTLDSSVLQTGNQIQQAYHSGNVETMKLFIDKLFSQFRNQKAAPLLVQDFCYSLLLQFGKNFFEGFQQIKGNSFSSEIRYTDSGSLKKIFLRMILNILCNFKPEDAKTDSDVVCHIKSYVDSNFDKDLSLETLSSHFFISKYQISRIFKKEFHVNYSDYILTLRMEQAEILLKSTNHKMYELSKMVGFEETSYFSNVFKKFYGISPKDYRLQNTKKEGTTND